MRIGAIILAAGYSSRMVGGFKPLLPIGGKTLLAHCADSFRQAGITAITVITGHRSEEVIAEAKRLGLFCCHNPDHDAGMFSSVRLGVRQAKDLDGFFLLPVDIPLIYSATITSLLARFDGKTVLLPNFADEPGHPPLLPAALRPDILAHDGRDGLQGVLTRHDCTPVPVWDRGILMDADTPDDFAALKQRWTTRGAGTRSEALELAHLTMPPRGVAHGREVAEVALLLGDALNHHGSGSVLDSDLLYNGGLLHDIGKGEPNHERRGAEILTSLGLERLSPIVAAHKSVALPPNGQLTEKEIVCLADKLVRGSRRVSILERFGDKLARYSDDPEAVAAIRHRLQEVTTLQTAVEKALGKKIDSLLNQKACP